MDHIERFYNTVEYKTVDRPASWLGVPTEKFMQKLTKYLGASSASEIRRTLDDDIFSVDMPYDSPVGKAIYCALNFSKNNFDLIADRTLTAPGFFEDYDSQDALGKFDWPDPAKYIDIYECKRRVSSAPKNMAVMGLLWSAHFQDACSAFGMENALIKMKMEPEFFRAVIDRITQFYIAANEIFYESTKGFLHAVLLGNDFGSQTGLMLSPDSIREFVMPGITQLVEQAKSYGLKVMYHSCGAIQEIIPDLIRVGIDVIHPIQALAKGMEPNTLNNKFSRKVAFCGGVDAQNLLVMGSPEEIKEKVLELKSIFPTGLIISPSHEAILPDVNPANIIALFDAVKE